MGQQSTRLNALHNFALPLSARVFIDTFAGGKIRSGVPAQEVALSGIAGLAWDASGNLVFCDSSNHVIRRTREDGTIEAIAGIGDTGYSGDGGPSAEALLNSPKSPRSDGSGNLYSGDSLNYRIRRIDARGIITTIAGNGIHQARL